MANVKCAGKEINPGAQQPGQKQQTKSDSQPFFRLNHANTNQLITRQRGRREDPTGRSKRSEVRTSQEHQQSSHDTKETIQILPTGLQTKPTLVDQRGRLENTTTKNIAYPTNDSNAAFNCRVLFIIQPTVSIKLKKKKEKIKGQRL